MNKFWFKQFVFLSAFSTFSAVHSSSAADWPQWLGPKRDGSTPEIVKPWDQPLKVLWRNKVGEGHSSPVVAGNLVILHTASSDHVDDEPEVRARTEYVTAYNIKTCEVAWVARMNKKPFQSQFGNGPRATPAIADGKVFCFGVTGTFSAFDLASGKLLASEVDLVEEHKAKVPFFGVSSSPLVDGETVYLMVGGPEAGIVGINTKTYKQTGKWLKDAASYSAPMAIGQGDQRQIVALTADALNGIAPNNSEPAWRFRFKDLLSESSATPIMAGEILVGSSVTLGSIGLKLSQKNGRPGVEEVWRNSALTCYFSTPVAVGPHVYMVTGKLPIPGPAVATLQCVDAATGKVLWSRPKVGTYGATLVRTGDNKLLLLEEPGILVLIQPDAGEYKELARAKVCGETWAHFAVANGKLFVRDRKELKCLALPTGP